MAAASMAVAQNTTPPPAQAPADLPDAPQATAAAMVLPNGPSVIMDTSMGRITCQFFEKQAPKAVANFIGLAQGTIDWTDPDTKKKMHHKPYFDNTTFHRVIPEFMIQGGDPTGTGWPTRVPIQTEVNFLLPKRDTTRSTSTTRSLASAMTRAST
jgi:peptidyl-prolyl cis-trans isomerase A (cyclophilin A)